MRGLQKKGVGHFRSKLFSASIVVTCIAVPAAAKHLPAPFVDAQHVVPSLETDIRYAGMHNFIGAPVTGYGAARCWLTRQAAAALARVQAGLAPRGFGLRVYACYRPARAVRRFVEWAGAPGEQPGKPEFFPDVAKRDLIPDGYIAARSSHSRGSTVDVTLVARAGDKPLDMGTPFDLFGPRSHPDAQGLPAIVVANRRLLREAMQRGGFVPYDKEWWHFTLKDEPFPETYFDAPIR